MSNFKRAVTKQQKIERYQIILKSTKELFEHSDFNMISVAEIASKAGLAKGSVFLYFKTKEELFLCLTMQEFGKWNEIFNQRLITFSKDEKSQSKELIDLLDKTLLSNTVLVRLLSMLNIILEQNISYELALEYKKSLYEQMQSTAEALENNIYFFVKGDGIRFSLYCFALIAGIHQMSNPAPIIKEAVKNTDYQIFNVNFRSYFIEMFKFILDGMEFNYKSEIKI